MLRATAAASPPSASIQVEAGSFPIRPMMNFSGTPVHSLVLTSPCVFWTVTFPSAFFQFSQPLPVHSRKTMRDTAGMAFRSSTEKHQLLPRHAVDQKPVLGGIQVGRAGVTSLVVQVGGRDAADQLLQRGFRVDGIGRIDVPLARSRFGNSADLHVFGPPAECA